MRRYGWLFLCAVFILFLALAYQIVDTEPVGAEQSQYEVPEEIIDAAERYGSEYGICPELIESMAWYESNYNRFDTSPTGCMGIMQVNPRWHGDRMARLGVSDLYDVDGCIHCGVDYLWEILQEEEEMSVALAIYNGQSAGNIEAARNGYVSKYAQAILDFSYELETLHGKHSRAHFDPDTADWETAKG